METPPTVSTMSAPSNARVRKVNNVSGSSGLRNRAISVTPDAPSAPRSIGEIES